MEFICEQCGQPVKVDDDWTGDELVCPHCQSRAKTPSFTGRWLRLKKPAHGQDITGQNANPAMREPVDRVVEVGAEEQLYECLNPDCGGVWEARYLTKREFGGQSLHVCPRCQLAMHRVRDEEVFDFWKSVPAAFGFAFRGRGKIVLMFGAVFFAFVDVARIVVCLLWPLLTVLYYGMVAMFLTDVARTAAQEGSNELDWPDFGNLGEVAAEGLRILMLGLIVFGPAVVCLFMGGAHVMVMTGTAYVAPTMAVWLIAGALLLGIGLVYFPMALLAVAITDTIWAVHPRAIGRAMMNAPAEYGCVLTMLGAMFFVGVGIEVVFNAVPMGWMKVAVFLVLRLAMLYALVTGAYLLGLMYRARGQQFGWL